MTRPIVRDIGEGRKVRRNSVGKDRSRQIEVALQIRYSKAQIHAERQTKVDYEERIMTDERREIALLGKNRRL